jgi:hypothetical protein
MDHELISPGCLTIAITGHRPKDLVTGTDAPIDLDGAIEALFARACARAPAVGVTRCCRGNPAVGVTRRGDPGAGGHRRGARGDQAVAAAVSTTKRWSGIAFESVIVLPFPVEVLGAR